jgi:ABC-type uncharacterized transport system involved in gliding motility auxiliary subunit
MNWIELAIYIACSALLTLFFIVNILLSVNNKRLRKDVAQLTLDKITLYSQLDQMSVGNQNKSLEQTEGFVKFISESREWAFVYIENVQEALEEYRQIADVVPISKDMTVEQAEKLSKAYDKIMSFLPEENLL